MRINAFQKILSLIYLILVTVCCVFYVPFHIKQGGNQNQVIYDSIWSDNQNIDIYRIGIYILVLSIIFYFLYRLLNTMNDLEVSVYKKKAKSEFRILLIFILGIIICLLFLTGNNLINYFRKNLLSTKIENNKRLITIEQSNSLKAFLDVDQKNVDRLDKIFKLYNNLLKDGYTVENLGTVDKFTSAISDSARADKIYSNLISDGYTEKNLGTKDDFLSTFSQKELTLAEFAAKIKAEYKEYANIDDSTLMSDIIHKQERVKMLTEQISVYYLKQDSFAFYSLQDFRSITLIWLVISFGLLYLVRPLFLFIKGIYTELK